MISENITILKKDAEKTDPVRLHFDRIYQGALNAAYDKKFEKSSQFLMNPSGTSTKLLLKKLNLDLISPTKHLMF